MMILKSAHANVGKDRSVLEGFTCALGAGAGKTSVIICYVLLKLNSGGSDLAVGSRSSRFTAGCCSRKQLDFIYAICVLNNHNFCHSDSGSEFVGCKSSAFGRDAAGHHVVVKNKSVCAGSNKHSSAYCRHGSAVHAGDVGLEMKKMRSR